MSRKYHNLELVSTSEESRDLEHTIRDYIAQIVNGDGESGRKLFWLFHQIWDTRYSVNSRDFVLFRCLNESFLQIDDLDELMRAEADRMNPPKDSKAAVRKVSNG